MPDEVFKALYTGAIEDFRRARRQADMKQILSCLSGKLVNAPSYLWALPPLLPVEERLPRR
jgi:hypothetical protein